MITWLKETLWAQVGLGSLVIAAIVGGFVIGTDRWGGLPDDAVLKYADRVVTEDELQQRVDILSALYGVQRPEREAEGEEFDRAAAKSMAVSLILEEQAVDHDIVVADRTARDQLDKLIEEQLLGGRDAFVDFLSEKGITEQDVLDEIKRQMATSRLVEELVQEVPEVTEDEARAAYEASKADMVTPETRHLRNIVVENQTDADRVARLAAEGRSFSDLARTWSLDSSTKDDGGDLGVLAAVQLEQEYAELAFAAAEGEIFGPVQSQYGWNVGKVAAINESKQLSYAEVEAELKQQLRTKERLDLWREELRTFLEEADVEYAEAYQPEDPTAPPSDITEGTGLEEQAETPEETEVP